MVSIRNISPVHIVIETKDFGGIIKKLLREYTRKNFALYLFGSKIGRIVLISNILASNFRKTKYVFQLRPFIFGLSKRTV